MNAYSIIRTFGIVVLLAAGIVQCSKIYERISDEETPNLVRTTRDKMTESDMAPVRNGRTDGNLQRKLTTHGKTIDAYLNPSDGQLIGENTPVWLASTGPDGTVEYRKMREGIVGIAVSTFWANRTDVPTVAVNQTEDGNMSFKESRLRRNSEAAEEEIRRLERQIREASRSGNRPDASRVKRSDKEIIYPSLLVQTYYKGAKTKSDELLYTEEIIYQLAFWNAVDLRFRQVSNPQIRIRISGIIIGLDQNTTPYLGNKTVDANTIQDEARKYWYTMSQREDFPAEAYNIVVTITDTDTYNRTSGWPGAIAARTACGNSSENRFHSVAIVRDNGAFDGILTATHALGDYLGAGYDPLSGDKCNPPVGFIMHSRQYISPKNLEWSQCSLNRLSYWLRMSHMNCFDEPAEFHPSGNPVQKVLPGDVLGPHEQCQARGYNWACDPHPEMCTKMECYHTNWQIFISGYRCTNTGPAAEGTVCAPGHKCVDGLCQCMAENCLYIE